jgi:hypothetical protein
MQIAQAFGEAVVLGGPHRLLEHDGVIGQQSASPPERNTKMGGFAAMSGDIGVMSGDIAAKPGDIGLMSGDISAKPGDIAAKPGDIGLMSGDIGSKPGDFAAKPEGKGVTKTRQRLGAPASRRQVWDITGQGRRFAPVAGGSPAVPGAGASLPPRSLPALALARRFTCTQGCNCGSRRIA